jgi:ADP-heptose:LPS heptosyltransferase
MSRIKILFVKFLNLINFLINAFLIKIIQFRKREIKENSLLIIRLDSIGDYVLVQNLFNLIKLDSPYKDYKVTLCGNIIWKDLAEYCNKDAFEKFIWINKKKFKWNIPYKFRILKSVYQSGFEVAIETTFSREILFGDTIIKASKAKERIGSTGSPESYVKWKRNLFSDNYYTKLITQSEKNIFEFYRNKEFFEKLFHNKIELAKPSLNFDDVEINLPTDKEFLVVVPGAQEKARRWSEENFTELIKHLLKEYHYDILLAGSSSEKSTIMKIIDGVNSGRVFDVSGKTSLPQFGKIISLAKLLISNETSAVHFAAAVNTPFVCISNGQRFGRFMPYPEEMKIRGKYIFPSEIENQLINKEFLEGNFELFSNLDINAIGLTKVLCALYSELNLI